MVEIFEHFKPKIEESNILEKMGIKEKDYILISLHREENVDNPKILITF